MMMYSTMHTKSVHYVVSVSKTTNLTKYFILGAFMPIPFTQDKFGICESTVPYQISPRPIHRVTVSANLKC